MIEVGRNSIVVRDVDIQSAEYKKATSRYSLYDKVQHKYTFNTYTLIDNDMYFPASIGIAAIQSCFPKKVTTINYKTTSSADSIKLTMKNQPKNELQQQAVDFLVNMQHDNT